MAANKTRTSGIIYQTEMVAQADMNAVISDYRLLRLCTRCPLVLLLLLKRPFILPWCPVDAPSEAALLPFLDGTNNCES